MPTAPTDLTRGIAKLDNGAKELADGVRAVFPTGPVKLAGGLDQLADGTDQLADGLKPLATGIRSSADRGVPAGHRRLAVEFWNSATWPTGLGQSATGAEQLSDGLTKLSDGGVKLSDGSRSWPTG